MIRLWLFNNYYKIIAHNEAYAWNTGDAFRTSHSQHLSRSRDRLILEIHALFNTLDGLLAIRLTAQVSGLVTPSNKAAI